MQVKTQIYIKNNPNISHYLRENSYWYKRLNRDPSNIFILEQEMKEAYHLTPQDKLTDLGKRIEMIRNFMDILK